MMIRDVPKPGISPNYTIEDIHKIRKWEDERLKDATPEEVRADMMQRVKKRMELLGIQFGYNAPKVEV